MNLHQDKHVTFPKPHLGRESGSGIFPQGPMAPKTMGDPGKAESRRGSRLARLAYLAPRDGLEPPT